MLKPKPARAPKTAKRTRRFSLVSDEALQKMYRALCALTSSGIAQAHAGGIPGAPALDAPEWSGAEVAEIGVCVAAGESCPLILACAAAGARTVSTASRIIDGEHRRLTSATLGAMDALLGASLKNMSSLNGDSLTGESRKKKSGKNALSPTEDVAIVCAGLLDSGPDAERDYRAAFRFAARHKLPILYVLANRLNAGKGAPLDLRTIYPEFGIPLFTVDANDAIAAYRVATEALHNARHLRGPSIIEALTIPGAASPLQLLTAYMERHGNPPR